MRTVSMIVSEWESRGRGLGEYYCSNADEVVDACFVGRKFIPAVKAQSNADEDEAEDAEDQGSKADTAREGGEG